MRRFIPTSVVSTWHIPKGRGYDVTKRLITTSIDWASISEYERDKPAIVWDMDPEESVLMTTGSEIKAFAQSVLDDIDIASERDDYLGISIRLVNRSYTQRLGEYDCNLVGLILVDTEEERRELLNRIRISKRLPPVAW